MTGHVIDRAKIKATERLIRPYIRRTPVIEVNSADFGFGDNPINLKLELMQHAGSFKCRGAFTNLLTREIAEAGVVAASGGNHGAAVAYAAMKLGIPARIFVPSISSPAKVERIRQYGAELVVGGFSAHTVVDKIAVHLWRKMRLRLLKPFKDQQPAFICERFNGIYD